MNIKAKLSQAIKTHHAIECIYHGKKRFIEPYHYGTLGGKMQLHCFQYDGESESGGLPEWRNLKLNEIKDIQIIEKHFTIRASYHPENAHYITIEQSIYDNATK
ncbi:WYL domain-containing protein [Legionella brunensis]|uniref:WYL domain-containing protein n=1 Tax=Legionella brunensis TaxID=29422 RepID=A0A0W0SEN8_9GAMM|nr:WYL domain-containing protein [Legionella brunensis]KTC81617.1 hypothetical protein Lbru_2137 [Legionella brunensis]